MGCNEGEEKPGVQGEGRVGLVFPPSVGFSRVKEEGGNVQCRSHGYSYEHP